MAVSAASTGDDPQRYYDEVNMQDMTQQERTEASGTSRRVEKLGKAFQNWRRAMLHLLKGMILKKAYFLAWRVCWKKQ